MLKNHLQWVKGTRTHTHTGSSLHIHTGRHTCIHIGRYTYIQTHTYKYRQFLTHTHVHMYINVGTSYLTRSEMFQIGNLTNICRHTIFFFIKNMSKWHLPLPAAANVRRTKCLLSGVLLREKSILTWMILAWIITAWMITCMNDTGKNDTGTNGCICHHTGTLVPQKHLLSSASWWHTPL